MRKRVKALLIPVIVLTMLLAGCKKDEAVLNPIRNTPVVIVTSTIFSPDEHSSTTDFQQCLDGAFTETRTVQ